MSIPAEQFQQSLLTWYTTHQRPLPWRQYNPPNPYHIWLAEIMLQQTTVGAVIPYYLRFLSSFPTVQSLAEAPMDAVLHHWQGLGYYRRAHLLHTCAKAVTEHHHGHFPNTEEGLLNLPGIGPYTAAAVAALAFNQPTSVVDGNVERVISRLYRIQEPLPQSKPRIKTLAKTLASPTHPCAYANAIMELGATVCTPTNPKCHQCPVQTFCEAHKHGDAPTYPRKSPKKKSPHLHATAFILTDPHGRIFLQQRPNQGLLASLWEPPAQCDNQPNPLNWPQNMPEKLSTQHSALSTSIQHTFTHFKLTVQVHHITTKTPHPAANAFTDQNLPPLSTLTRKILGTLMAA